MNLASGIFTVPVNGVYHFEFSGHKDASTTTHWGIHLQLNGENVGLAGTSNTANFDSGALTVSLRLKANDLVNLYKYQTSALFEDSNGHHTHFTGWLVEEDL